MKLKVGDLVMAVEFWPLPTDMRNYMLGSSQGTKIDDKNLYEVEGSRASYGGVRCECVRVSGENPYWLKSSNFVKVGSV